MKVRRLSTVLLSGITVAVGLTLAGATTGAHVAEATEKPNRKSCSAIQGTAYHSVAEREWYWQHCIGRPLPAVVAQEFAEGYRQAGGPEYLLQHILDRVIPCESSYDPRAFNAAGPYFGLMQFLPATWRAAGGGDWYSAWQQGANTARLLRMAHPETQWPYCWFA